MKQKLTRYQQANKEYKDAIKVKELIQKKNNSIKEFEHITKKYPSPEISSSYKYALIPSYKIKLNSELEEIVEDTVILDLSKPILVKSIYDNLVYFGGDVKSLLYAKKFNRLISTIVIDDMCQFPDSVQLSEDYVLSIFPNLKNISEEIINSVPKSSLSVPLSKSPNTKIQPPVKLKYAKRNMP